MAGANIIFYNGLHLEGKMAEIFEKMSRRIKTVAVAASIDPALLQTPEAYEGNYDPHIWFDVSLWRQAVEAVRDALIEYDASHAELYNRNAAAYLQELSALHQYVQEQAQRIRAETRVLVTAHDAFNYFGAAYGFQVRGLQGISTAAETGTADVQDLADFIVARKIPAMFVETSVSPRYIEALQAAVKSKGFAVEIGGKLFSDAMGNPTTAEGTYVGMVRHNIDTIVKALLKTAS
jgi:manganese/zinc/iron transport system substrate-binding protein